MRPVGETNHALDCEQVARALWEYLDGRVRAECLTGIEDHLARCGECRSHAAFQARLMASLAGLRGRHSDPLRLRNDVLARLREAGMGRDREG